MPQCSPLSGQVLPLCLRVSSPEECGLATFWLLIVCVGGEQIQKCQRGHKKSGRRIKLGKRRVRKRNKEEGGDIWRLCMLA